MREAIKQVLIILGFAFLMIIIADFLTRIMQGLGIPVNFFTGMGWGAFILAFGLRVIHGKKI